VEDRAIGSGPLNVVCDDRSKRANFWNGNDKLAAPATILSLLLEDLFGEIPRQEQQVVGL
jgi:hypothetical protein